MEVDDFVKWWRERERADIERMVDALGTAVGTADGEVCRVRARAEVAALLRRSGRCRLGCRAAHRCSLAAMEACARTGLLGGGDRTGAILLARAAGDAGRALVAEAVGVGGRSWDVRVPGVDELLQPFQPVLAFSPAA